ncbi:hypothetical protein BDV96DRAFT_292888 [Lophiotrema nucula]|uniref:Uncharacterized protein n=1 Tax=Lophiotrema nucula TaxID=690887 RepID=A0A6A5YN99_9PLEO|nr:hypothetical protein BDV96DRAFT_292888 [Lophiotrema nucula]
MSMVPILAVALNIIVGLDDTRLHARWEPRTISQVVTGLGSFSLGRLGASSLEYQAGLRSLHTSHKSIPDNHPAAIQSLGYHQNGALTSTKQYFSRSFRWMPVGRHLWTSLHNALQIGLRSNNGSCRRPI